MSVICRLNAVGAGAQEIAYALVDLGPYTHVADINDAGDVVGEVRRPDRTVHAFLYSKGAMHDLGTLGGPASAATGINNAGTIVGWSQTSVPYGDNRSTRYEFRAFIYSEGTMRAMESADRDQAGSTRGMEKAVAINSAGQVVIELDGLHPALWSQGTIARLPSLVPTGAAYPGGVRMNRDGTRTQMMNQGPGYVVVKRMNDSGNCVGTAVSRTGDEHAVWYEHGTIHDLHQSAWKISVADGLNDRDQIVGHYRTTEGKFCAFLYDRGRLTALVGPPDYESCYANAINDRGEIVGHASTITGGGFLRTDAKLEALVYEQGHWMVLSALVALKPDGLILNDAVGINRRGQIIGQGSGQGSYRGFVLTPLPTPGS